MSPIMTVYAALAVPSVVTIVIMFLLVNIKPSGKAEVTNARWVTVKGGWKVRNATVKELWEHNNPGLRWDYEQEKKRKIRVKIAIPIAIIIPYFITEVLPFGLWVRLVAKGHGPVWITYITVLVIAGIGAGIIFGVMNLLNGGIFLEDSLWARIIGFIVIVLGGVELLYMIVLGVVGCIAGLKDKEPTFVLFRFYRKSLPFAFIGAGILFLSSGLVLLIRFLLDKAEKKRIEKNGPSDFVMDLILNPDLSCSSCHKTFRKMDSDTVWLKGRKNVICSACHFPWDGGMAINYIKAKELADSIRASVSNR